MCLKLWMCVEVMLLGFFISSLNGFLLILFSIILLLFFIIITLFIIRIAYAVTQFVSATQFRNQNATRYATTIKNIGFT